jgi:hypothetical protein
MRPYDIACMAAGVEYNTIGKITELLDGVDLSMLEKIWDKMLKEHTIAEEQRDKIIKRRIIPQGRRRR